MSHRPLSLLASLLILGSAGSAFGSKLYKWTDDQGRVHYSDRIPPEAAAREREIKSDRGLTMVRVEAAKTREQLAAEQAEREREEARRRAEEEAARQQALADRNLLLTFTSTAQIERARDERVALINGQITLTQSSMEKLQEQLQKTREQAANAERTGRGKPEELHKRVRDLERQLAEHAAFVQKREQERAAIIARFDADLARFKELKAAEAR